MLQLLENLETQENGAEAANIPIPEETIPQETGESMGALLDAEAMPPEKPMPAAEPVPAEAPKQEMAEKKTMPAPAPEPVRKRIEESMKWCGLCPTTRTFCSGPVWTIGNQKNWARRSNSFRRSSSWNRKRPCLLESGSHPPPERARRRSGGIHEKSGRPVSDVQLFLLCGGIEGPIWML